MQSTLQHHEQIKIQLRRSGSSFAAVARELGLSRTTVTIVSQGQRRSRRVDTAIARKLGLKLADLWPDRYRGVNRVERNVTKR